jgi:hypothetical protein
MRKTKHLLNRLLVPKQHRWLYDIHAVGENNALAIQVMEIIVGVLFLFIVNVIRRIVR